MTVTASDFPLAANHFQAGQNLIPGVDNADLAAILNYLHTAATDAGTDTFTDSASYYTTDTINAALAALAGQIGGDDDASFDFAEENVLADDDAIYAALEKLDLYLGDLANAGAATEGANLVGIEDSGALITATTVEGALAENRALLDQAKKTIHAMAVFGTWQQDGDAALTNGGGLCGADVKLTEAANTYAQVYDAGNAEFNQFDSSSGGTDYTGDYQFTSDTKNDGDYVAFGHSVPFPEIAMEMTGGTLQTYTGDAGKWQYSQGGAAWADLTVFDNTDATAQNGKRPFGRDGAITFAPPSDWATETINGQEAYWIRWIVTTVANLNVVGLTNSKEHQFVRPEDGWIAPCDGVVEAIRACDGTTGTLHSNQDVKFLVMNYTNGRNSGVLTWAQDRRTDGWDGLSALAISDGDILGVVCTQDDGAGGGPDEVINALLEMEIQAA